MILVELPFGFTLYDDATALRVIPDCRIEPTADMNGCYFLYTDMGAILEGARRSNIDIVICDPPEDGACHLFN
ncbi:hypothetical protein [Puia sp.]|uniref:hypothetical protein n=1 Tax=Puia sp. TaxID=2045100 RepID=UPI002D7F294F|nr:hypothetical protein [Puia sp.]